LQFCEADEATSAVDAAKSAPPPKVAPPDESDNKSSAVANHAPVPSDHFGLAPLLF
jgi:hypothetical protein